MSAVRTYQCLQCNRNTVRLVSRIADRQVTDAVCAYCGFRLQASGPVDADDEAVLGRSPNVSKRGRDLGRVKLNTECDECDHELRDHDFSHPTVRCQAPGCSCWAFREEGEVGV